jgi:uncharacterized protein
MARIIAWLVLIFLVLLALRMIARRNSRRGSAAAQAAAQPMVRCARCGVFLPRAEAKEIDGSYVCSAEGCLPHG